MSERASTILAIVSRHLDVTLPPPPSITKGTPRGDDDWGGRDVERACTAAGFDVVPIDGADVDIILASADQPDMSSACCLVVSIGSSFVIVIARHANGCFEIHSCDGEESTLIGPIDALANHLEGLRGMVDAALIITGGGGLRRQGSSSVMMLDDDKTDVAAAESELAFTSVLQPFAEPDIAGLKLSEQRHQAALSGDFVTQMICEIHQRDVIESLTKLVKDEIARTAAEVARQEAWLAKTRDEPPVPRHEIRDAELAAIEAVDEVDTTRRTIAIRQKRIVEIDARVNTVNELRQKKALDSLRCEDELEQVRARILAVEQDAARRAEEEALKQKLRRDNALRPFECPFCSHTCSHEDAYYFTCCGNDDGGNDADVDDETDTRKCICRGCAVKFYAAELIKGRLEIKCPFCNKSPIALSDLYDVLPDRELQFLRRLEWKKIQVDCGMLFCHHADCPGLVHPADLGQLGTPSTAKHHFVCNLHPHNPAHQWCLNCNAPWHEGQTCEKYQEWRQNNNNADAETEKLINEMGWKKCPECNDAFERESGCNAMQCPLGHCYCYLCGEGLGSDLTAAHGHFNILGTPCYAKCFEGLGAAYQ